MKPRITGISIGREWSVSVAYIFRGVFAMIAAICAGASPGQAPPASGPEAGSSKFTNSLGMTFRQVPGSPVLMSVWETRVSDWDAYLQWQKGKITWEHRPQFPQTGEHPVVNVTLADAQRFCEWLTKIERAAGVLGPTQLYRLPAEHEWDAAVGVARKETARPDAGNASRRFPWGNQWPPMRQSGNYNFKHMQAGRDDGFAFTAPVGQFMPAPGGFYDLGGNVWEWTMHAATSPVEDAVLRGGAWMYWRQDCLESGYRYITTATTRAPTIGFRCVFEDTTHTSEHRKRLEHAETQARLGLQERSEVSEEEVVRMKAELQKRKERKQETDPAEKARLLKKPTVDQTEIDEFRRALNGGQDSGTDAAEPGK